MSKLKLLKAASSLSDLAPLLNVKPAALSFALYKIPPEKKYVTFTVAKKSGGVRQISAPELRLKKIQKALNRLLHECRSEIESLDPKRKVVSHGFRKKYSIVTNARAHRHKRYVLNFDIENFFPSINFGRVRGFFMKDVNFALHQDVATVIAQIACHDNQLPQGAPSSPIISDFIGRLLDVRLVRLAKIYKCRYTRYADDITFSTDKKTFPIQLAYQIEGIGSPWVLGNSLSAAISDAGFSVNHPKTRVQYRDSRQTVTGLIVNSKVNIRSEYYKNARAMCHRLFATGEFSKQSPNGEEGSGTLRQMEGIVSHIYQIKREEAYRKNKNKHGFAVSGKGKKTGVQKLYEHLLFFKYCAAPDKPVILCEGKTDAVYLKAAIRRLTQFHGVLGQMEGKIFKYGVNFFPYGRFSSEALDLHGGTGDLASLMSRYSKEMEGYKYCPKAHPVIIIADNDKGLQAINNAAGPHVTISLETTAKYYPILLNLYVVKTLETNGASEIENCFPSEILEVELNGKKLNLKKEHDSPGEYGKSAFAQKVVLPQLNVIDFSGFSLLLDRIVAARDDYYAATGAG